MKKALMLWSLFTVLFTTRAGAQFYSWQQSRGPEGGRIQELFLLNAQTMLVSMFDQSGVYRSTNGGSSWVQLPLQTPYFYSYVPNSAGKIYAGAWGDIYSSADAGLTWTVVTPVTGEVVGSMCIDSTGRIFAGTWSGNVLRSTDGGLSWTKAVLTNARSIDDLAVAKNGTILAATYVGMYRSTDGGDTWLQLSSGLPATHYQTILTTANFVFAGTYGAGIYRSSDGGTTWTALNTGPVGLYVYDLALGTFGQLYAATTNGVTRSVDNGINWSLQANSGLTGQAALRLTTNPSGGLIAGTTAGTFSSTDFGNNWVSMNSGIKATYVRALAVNPNGYVFAGAVGMHRSTDLGNTWTLVGLQNAEIRSIAATTTSTLYASVYAGAYRSTDNGTSWQATSVIGPCVVVAGQGGTVFAGVTKGVLRSTNYGVSWDSLNSGLPSVPCTAIAVSSAGDLYAATESNGLYAMPVGANAWTKTSMNQEAVTLSCSPDGSTLFAGIRAAGLYRSTNKGYSWTQMNSAFSTGRTMSSLTMDSQGRIFATGLGWGVYRSSDGGSNWTDVNPGLAFQYQTISSLAILPSGSVLAGTWGAGVILGTPVVLPLPVAAFSSKTVVFSESVRIGQFKDTTISIANTGADTLKIQSIASSNLAFSARPTSKTVPPGLSFVDTLRFAPTAVGAASGILVLTSNALSSPDTIKVSGIGSGQAMVALSTSVLSIGGAMLGQTKDALLTISSTGNDTLKIQSMTSSSAAFSARPTSKTVPPGLSFVDTIRFAPTAVGPISADLRITSNAPTSPDMVKLTAEGLPAMTGIADGTIPSTFGLSQNYPNPFNPSTMIRYALPKASNVSLKVFNTLGQVMDVLIDEIKQAGYYQVPWDATSAPSGIYFYRLQAGDFIETHRMILIR